MKENKYWWVILLLETILILMLLNFVKELERHGFYFVGRTIGIVVLLYIFYGFGKSINDIMK